MNDYQLNLQMLHADRIVKECCLLLYYEFEKKGIKADIRIPEGNSECYCVSADYQAMERIVNNMLWNALRYAETFLQISLFCKEDKVGIRFANDTRELTEEEVEHFLSVSMYKKSPEPKGERDLDLRLVKCLQRQWVLR